MFELLCYHSSFVKRNELKEDKFHLIAIIDECSANIEQIDKIECESEKLKNYS